MGFFLKYHRKSCSNNFLSLRSEMMGELGEAVGEIVNAEKDVVWGCAAAAAPCSAAP